MFNSRCRVCKIKAEANNKTLEIAVKSDGVPEKVQPVGITKRLQGNTRCMIAHYQSHHVDLLPEVAKNKQMQLTKQEENSKKRKLLDVNNEGVKMKQMKLTVNPAHDLALDVKHDPALQKEWDHEVNKFVALTNCSYSLVGGAPFRNLINWILRKARYTRVPPINLKDRKAIARDVMKDAEYNKDRIVHVIRHFKPTISSISLTADIWTDVNYRPYISLTLTFLTDEMELIRLVPFVSYFPQRHTGMNIKLKVEKMLQALEIRDLNLFICSDNAANCKLGFSLLPGVEQMFCINHTIQLGVRDSLKEQSLGTNIKDLVSKCHELAKKVKKNTQMLNELAAACKDVGVNYTKMQLSQVTRWNSTAANIDSILKIQPALEELFSLTTVSESWSEFEITKHEWKQLKAIHTMLQKILVVSKIFETETKVTIHLVLPKLYELRVLFENFENSSTNDR